MVMWAGWAVGAASGNARKDCYWPLNINGVPHERIELSVTAREHERGLMDRDALPPGGGMLFVYPRENFLYFWMKNCRMDIDVAFLDADGRVVGLQHMPRETPRRPGESLDDYERRLPIYTSERPARYALELAGGQLEVLNVRAGDRIDVRARELERFVREKCSRKR
ncbi:MAG: DUF192 domain-containing protein [Deltaproteobacteria bacterium]|nr:DUF192 domain-containing protein [Deltaproteobacteria bacterium]